MIKVHIETKEELANTLTHAIGILFSVIAIVVLLAKAIPTKNGWYIGSFLTFGSTMLLCFLTSTSYHANLFPSMRPLLRKLDHSAIYLFIAGTYTPFTLIILREVRFWGWTLFGVVWTAAILGILFSFRKMKKMNHWKTVCYIAMGWVVVFAIQPLIMVLSATDSIPILYWLAIGGGFYTVGAIFYSLNNVPYMHSIWHLFVLSGAFSHFVAILQMA